jgi:hypothetical protein
VGSVLLSKTALPSETGRARTAESETAELALLSSDGHHRIGTTHFTATRQNMKEEISGESRYVNGEHDNEVVTLDQARGQSSPSLETYEHRFFSATGSLYLLDTLNAKTGVASCAKYVGGERQLRTSQLAIPGDTYAGASELLVVAADLRRGIREISFHAFACVPGPRIFAVKASLSGQPERWPFYKGDLLRLGIQPDLGALNLVFAPFIPKTDAWFDPKENWNYVGGEFDRFFRGPHVVAVRVDDHRADP